MTRPTRLARILIAILSFCLLAACRSPVVEQEGLLLRNITVVDVVNGDTLTDRDIALKDGRIVELSVGRIPTNSFLRVIDGAGKYVIPGLIDAHVHLFARAYDEWSFPWFIRYGVTGVREMWTPRDSLVRVAHWRREFERGAPIPRILAAGALVEGDALPWMESVDRVATPVAGQAFVRNAQAAGYDFIKVYSHLDPATYAAILREASRSGVEVSGHVPLRVGIHDALRAGQVTNEHLHQVTIACTTEEERFLREREAFYEKAYTLDEEFALLDRQLHETTRHYSEEKCRETARRIAAAGQWQVPTLVNERRWFLGVDHGALDENLLAAVPDSMRQSWDRSLAGGETYSGEAAALDAGWDTYSRTVSVLAEAGVPILAGTDFAAPYVYPGLGLHEELALLVKAGLTPLAALQAATINPARYLGLADTFGSVEAGKVADLVILRKNPLADIENTRSIEAVLLGGRLVHPVQSGTRPQ